MCQNFVLICMFKGLPNSITSSQPTVTHCACCILTVGKNSIEYFAWKTSRKVPDNVLIAPRGCSLPYLHRLSWTVCFFIAKDLFSLKNYNWRFGIFCTLQAFLYSVEANVFRFIMISVWFTINVLRCSGSLSRSAHVSFSWPDVILSTWMIELPLID